MEFLAYLEIRKFPLVHGWLPPFLSSCSVNFSSARLLEMDPSQRSNTVLLRCDWSISSNRVLGKRQVFVCVNVGTFRRKQSSSFRLLRATWIVQ